MVADIHKVFMGHIQPGDEGAPDRVDDIYIWYAYCQEHELSSPQARKTKKEGNIEHIYIQGIARV